MLVYVSIYVCIHFSNSYIPKLVKYLIAEGEQKHKILFQILSV